MDMLPELEDVVIGIDRDRPSLDNLARIAQRFALLPYENLTKIIRAEEIPGADAARRDPVAVLSDHRRFGTGGTCFSLTHCLEAVLTGRGYRCGPRMADLGRGRNNHCALVVVFGDREYLIDPGYLITTPLPMPEQGNVVHPTRLYPVRLERETAGEALHLTTLEPDGEKYRYRLHPDPVSPAEFIRHWEASFAWPMMRSLLITRTLPAGRLYLHDRHLRWYRGASRRSQKISTAFDRTVADETGIDPAVVRRARMLIARYKRKLEE